MSEEEYVSVSAVFDQYFKLYEEIEKSDLPTNSDKLQAQIKEAIDGLIKATVLVSELGVFSSNETIDDLVTSSIKFLLLPVLLGSLTLKRTDIERLKVLRLAGVYYRDFLKRCKEYELTDIDLPEEASDGDDVDDTELQQPPGLRSAKQGFPTPQELQAMSRQRADKIRRFKEKKAIENRLIDLKKALENPSHDEDILRKYYISMIKKFIHESIDEIDNLTMERNMLEQMAAMKSKGILPSPEDQPKVKPLRPILITRDAIQKNVFGLGYPSLPSMTVEEFYDQRVQDGWFPDPAKSRSCLQDVANTDSEANRETEDREEEEKERAEEQDDPEKLARDRERDEWRDTHRRGWGNTYNRS